MRTREEMMDRVIRKFGFENDKTIWFCRLCEYPQSDFNDKIIEVSFQALMEN